MATKIRVTPEQLNNTAGQVDSQASQFKTLYERLYTEVDGIKASHKSDATDTFVTKAVNFKKEFVAMENLLKKYAQFLRDAARDYTTTDNQLAADGNARLASR